MDLKYTIAGENYILIDYFISTESGAREAKKLMKKYDCILQGATRNNGFWSSTGNIKILVPEKNILNFNKDML